MIQRFWAAITVVAVACAIQAQGKLKVYISVDAEAIAGDVADDQTSPNGKDYIWARSMMLDETNAAIAGAFDAGATEVLVNASHGPQTKLRPDEPHRRA